MTTDGLVDTCIHQVTTDYVKMADRVPEPWSGKLRIKSKIEDPAAGTLMQTLPWHHAYWNEDAPDYDRPEGAYTNSEQYRSPERMDAHLEEQGVTTALLTGHQVKFLPTIMNPEFTAHVASAYNELLVEEWLSASDRMVGGILVPMNDPEAAVEEVERYASEPDMVTVLIYGGTELPFGHREYRPVFDAAADADLPVTIHTSENPAHRQVAMGVPDHYVTYNTNVMQNHYTNLVSMLFQGFFDDYPDLDVVWAGEGVGWILQPLWRCTRYYRNLEPQVPRALEKEPHEYLENLYVTTYPLGAIDDDTTEWLFETLGTEHIMYASGYPHWNSDTPDVIPDGLGERDRENVFVDTARRVYGL